MLLLSKLREYLNEYTYPHPCEVVTKPAHVQLSLLVTCTCPGVMFRSGSRLDFFPAFLTNDSGPFAPSPLPSLHRLFPRSRGRKRRGTISKGDKSE